jgi:bifunctional lysine-specific demethylase and histidyl-hydroxylase NO66
VNDPRSAVERCVGDPERFASEIWSRTPLFHRSGGSFDDLMSAGDVDRMLTTMSLRLPAFRLVKDGATIPRDRYIRRGRTGGSAVTGIADPRRILALYRQGATIVLQGMHRYWQPLRRLCRDLETELGHPCQVNAYVTPPGARGLAVHTDDHDVFVLQSFGEKHWEVWPPGAGRHPSGPPVITETLTPGDCLYMPKGTPHAARTQEGPSGHLTVGILSTTWRDVLDDVVEATLADASFDEPLPAGFHRDRRAFAGLIADRLAELGRTLEKVDAIAEADAAVDRFLTARPALLEGAFLDAMTETTLDARTTIVRRPGSICEIRTSGDRLEVLLGDRRLRMPRWVEPAVRALATGEVDSAAALAERGHLDVDSALVLIRRLVREGLLRIAVSA